MKFFKEIMLLVYDSAGSLCYSSQPYSSTDLALRNVTASYAALCFATTLNAQKAIGNEHAFTVGREEKQDSPQLHTLRFQTTGYSSHIFATREMGIAICNCPMKNDGDRSWEKTRFIPALFAGLGTSIRPSISISKQFNHQLRVELLSEKAPFFVNQVFKKIFSLSTLVDTSALGGNENENESKNENGHENDDDDDGEEETRMAQPIINEAISNSSPTSFWCCCGPKSGIVPVVSMEVEVAVAATVATTPSPTKQPTSTSNARRFLLPNFCESDSDSEFDSVLMTEKAFNKALKNFRGGKGIIAVPEMSLCYVLNLNLNSNDEEKLVREYEKEFLELSARLKALLL